MERASYPPSSNLAEQLGFTSVIARSGYRFAYAVIDCVLPAVLTAVVANQKIPGSVFNKSNDGFVRIEDVHSRLRKCPLQAHLRHSFAIAGPTVCPKMASPRYTLSV